MKMHFVKLRKCTVTCRMCQSHAGINQRKCREKDKQHTCQIPVTRPSKDLISMKTRQSGSTCKTEKLHLDKYTECLIGYQIQEKAINVVKYNKKKLV